MSYKEVENQEQGLVGSESREGQHQFIELLHDEDSNHHPHEEEGEPWLVSYADMMTLLFGFFVVMYSFATRNPAAQECIRLKLSQAFNLDENPEADNIKSLTIQLIDSVNKDRFSKASSGKAVEQVTSKLSGGLGTLGRSDKIGDGSQSVKSARQTADSEQMAALINSIQTLIDNLDKEVFDKDDKLSSIFSSLTKELDKRADRLNAKVEEKSKRDELVLVLPTTEVFDKNNSLLQEFKLVLSKIVSETNSMSPRPLLKVETFAGGDKINDGPTAMSKSMEQASIICVQLVKLGVDPALLSSAAYGNLKPLVTNNEFDESSLASKDKRNDRVIISVERRNTEYLKKKKE